MRLLLVCSALCIAAVSPSFGATVDLLFSGVINYSDIAGLPIGSNFTGEAQYSTGAPSLSQGINAAFYALAPGSLSLTTGGNTVTNDNAGSPGFMEVAAVGVPEFGALELGGNSVAGTGPLDGGGVAVQFYGSVNPALLALTIPFPFPTDFTGASIVVNPSSPDTDSAGGSITSYSVINTANAVPEPSTAAFFVLSSLIAAVSWKRYRN